MKLLNKLFLGKFLSTSLAVFLGFGFSAQAKHHGKNHNGKGKGPCAEIVCEQGDKFCYDKKKECMSKMFTKRMEKARSEGVSVDKKNMWVQRLEKRVTKKRERIQQLQTNITEIEANIKQVRALKTK